MYQAVSYLRDVVEGGEVVLDQVLAHAVFVLVYKCTRKKNLSTCGAALRVVMSFWTRSSRMRGPW